MIATFLTSRFGRRRLPWLAQVLSTLAREQRGIARAARSVVSDGAPDALEELLCRAESLQERLADLCERAAAIAALRAMAARARGSDDSSADRRRS